jgi:hypothetical protein
MFGNRWKKLSTYDESLYALSQKTQMERDLVIRYAVLFAHDRKDAFLAYIEADEEQKPSRRRFKLRFDLNVFAFLMFVLGMMISIAVMMARR